MTTTAYVTAIGPLVGVVIGALLTSRTANRAHRTDVRREVYGRLLLAAYAYKEHDYQGGHWRGARRPEGWNEQEDELISALEVAAAVVEVSGSHAASDAAARVRLAAERLAERLPPTPADIKAGGFGSLHDAEAAGPGSLHEVLAEDLSESIDRFMAVARQDVSGESRWRRSWRAQIRQLEADRIKREG